MRWAFTSWSNAASRYFRRALRSALPVDETNPWMRYAGMVETGDPESSRNIDDVVYGHKD